MKKLGTIILLGSLAVAGMSMAQADEDFRGHVRQHGMACHHERGDSAWGDRVERMQAYLNLSESQMKQIGEIVAKSSTDSQALRKSQQVNRQQLWALLQTDNPDEAKIHTLAQDQGRIRTDMIVLHSKLRVAINHVLTPEQRQKLQTRSGARPHHDDSPDTQS